MRDAVLLKNEVREARKNYRPRDQSPAGRLLCRAAELCPGGCPVIVEFDAWGADDVRPQHWHWSEELTELPKGRLRVKFTLSSLEEVEAWILSFGAHAMVIEPRELPERIQKVGREVAEKYR